MKPTKKPEEKTCRHGVPLRGTHHCWNCHVDRQPEVKKEVKK